MMYVQLFGPANSQPRAMNALHPLLAHCDCYTGEADHLMLAHLGRGPVDVNSGTRVTEAQSPNRISDQELRVSIEGQV